MHFSSSRRQLHAIAKQKENHPKTFSQASRTHFRTAERTNEGTRINDIGVWEAPGHGTNATKLQTYSLFVYFIHFIEREQERERERKRVISNVNT